MILIFNRSKLFLIISIIFIILISGLANQTNFLNDKVPRTIGQIPVPNGFTRVSVKNNKFASFLRNLELLPPGSTVLDFKGRVFKDTTDTSISAVVNYDIYGKRLEQCMDILIKFYAEFLWQEKEAFKLILPLPGGHRISWQSWKEGFRPHFSGIKVKMKKTAAIDSSRKCYEKYLQLVFAESHTQQFYYAYQQVKYSNIQIGDIIVKKGTKGHAVMIVDLAKDKKGHYRALVGQGDTPACQFHLLNYREKSPWFPIDFNKKFPPLPISKKMTWDGLRRF